MRSGGSVAGFSANEREPVKRHRGSGGSRVTTGTVPGTHVSRLPPVSFYRYVGGVSREDLCSHVR